MLELVLPFNSLDSRDLIQVVRLGQHVPLPDNHFAGPFSLFLGIESRAQNLSYWSIFLAQVYNKSQQFVSQEIVLYINVK